MRASRGYSECEGELGFNNNHIPMGYVSGFAASLIYLVVHRTGRMGGKGHLHGVRSAIIHDKTS